MTSFAQSKRPTSLQQRHIITLYHIAGEVTSNPKLPSGSMVILSWFYRTFTLLLRSFASQHQRVRFWIDAVCINQVGDEGKAEENAQIPLMSRIYHQAASVIVWLGAAEYDSNKTLDNIIQQKVEAMQNLEFATDFGRLLKRPWFRRT